VIYLGSAWLTRLQLFFSLTLYLSLGLSITALFSSTNYTKSLKKLNNGNLPELTDRKQYFGIYFANNSSKGVAGVTPTDEAFNGPPLYE